LKRKKDRFVWGDEQQAAFRQLKEALTTVLQIPEFSKEFALVCDASDVAISAVLHHRVRLPVVVTHRTQMFRL
jgi:hypothetical protein